MLRNAAILPLAAWIPEGDGELVAGAEVLARAGVGALAGLEIRAAAASDGLPASAILAGGASRRFGRDKAEVVVGGARAIDQVASAAAETGAEVVVVGGAAPLPPQATSRIPDLHPRGGPLQALVAAMHARPHRDIMLLACDLPWLDPRLLELLCRPLAPGTSARIPHIGGKAQPLAARYAATAEAALARALAEGARSMHAVLELLCPEWLGEPALRAAGIDPASLRDFDTPEDLELA